MKLRRFFTRATAPVPEGQCIECATPTPSYLKQPPLCWTHLNLRMDAVHAEAEAFPVDVLMPQRPPQHPLGKFFRGG
jgi:hypothetical protein